MLLCQVTQKARTKIEVKLFLLNSIFFLSLFMNDNNIRHYFIGYLLLHDPPDIGFTSCQASPSDKISRLKGKPLQINESFEGNFLQLCCLVGSNFRNLYSMVSILLCVKGQKLQVILGPKRENLKTQKQKRNKTKEKQNFLFQFAVHRNLSSLEISCHI